MIDDVESEEKYIIWISLPVIRFTKITRKINEISHGILFR